MFVYPMSRLRLATVCSPPLSGHPPFGYLSCFKSDLDAVKSNAALFNDLMKNALPPSAFVTPPSGFVTPQCLFPQFCYHRFFKPD